jgi:3'-phosphoadenosine 5'-phosphosulfate sulfotransferase (PAPS reductase)/FAD synthetase
MQSEFKAEKIIVPVSGGKDSQLTFLLALEDGREVIPVFNETGWDHPLTYEHLKYMESQSGLTIQNTLYAEAPTMPDIIRKFKQFPFGLGRFCTSEYKRTAFIRWLDTVEGTCEIWLGVRKDESGQRKKKYGHFDYDDLYTGDDLFKGKFPKRIKERMRWRVPMVEHTRAEVFEGIHSRGQKHNPLYDAGFDRVGCFPCLLAGEETQRMAYEFDDFGKQQFNILKLLEKEIGKEYKFQPEGSDACGLCSI